LAGRSPRPSRIGPANAVCERFPAGPSRALVTKPPPILRGPHVSESRCGAPGMVGELASLRPWSRALPGTDSARSNTARPRVTAQNAHRCGQPGQQHGRRMPSLSSEHTLSTCCRLISSFLTEMVQQIHSLRASGVMSSQASSAFASDASAFRRSAGSLCTTPSEIRTVVIT